jgi:hypothetical protein
MTPAEFAARVAALRGVTPAARVALEYAAGGFLVFPIGYGTKFPLKGSHGHLDATCDPVAIRELFAQRPKLNVGVVCAPSGIVVVDSDVRNGGDETLAALEKRHGSLPDTPRVLSGANDGSQHFYFQAVEGARYGTSLGPGVDVKWNGYVVVPPSVRGPDENCPRWRRYQWDVGAHISEIPIAEAPAWIALGGAGPRSPRPHRDAVAPAAESFLAVAFEIAGWLGEALPAGRIAVKCPWAHEHTDGRGLGKDSSTVILPPTTDDHLGAWACKHGHCAGRDVLDVLDALPKHAVARAAATYPRALGRLAWRRGRAALQRLVERAVQK